MVKKKKGKKVTRYRVSRAEEVEFENPAGTLAFGVICFLC